VRSESETQPTFAVRLSVKPASPLTIRQGTAVTFGSAPATNVKVPSAISITSTVPSITAGAANVVVSVGGINSPQFPFTVNSPPTIATLNVLSQGNATGSTKKLMIEVVGVGLLPGGVPPTVLVVPGIDGVASLVGPGTDTLIRAEFTVPQSYQLQQVVLSYANRSGRCVKTAILSEISTFFRSSSSSTLS
jgi:hypothetical protein